MSQNSEMGNERTELLRDIRLYVRIQTAILLREEAKKLLDVREKAEVYGRLDGTKTHQELSRIVGIPRKTVTNWVGEFVQSGLAVDVRGSNDRALFTLEELKISPRLLKKRGSKPH